MAIIYWSADVNLIACQRWRMIWSTSKVSVILAIGGPVPARAAKATTGQNSNRICVRRRSVSDSLVAGLQSTWRKCHRRNFIGTALTTKKLEPLREIAPGVMDIGLLVNPAGTLAEIQIKDAKEAIQRLGQRLHVANVSGGGEIDAAFSTMRQLKVGALLVSADPIFATHRDQLTALAARYKIPAMYNTREYCEAGGLMSYGASILHTWSQAGVYVARILKGEKPAYLPVMQPTKFELVINLKTARALGLTVPPALLTRADEVIE